MNKVKLLFLSLLLISALFINTKALALLPLSGKVIVLDAGHGGLDPGTTSNNIYEKDINLAITKYLEMELSASGASVILTRDGDYDLSYPKANYRKKSDFDNRIKLINNSNANMYKQIAEVIQNVLNKELNNDRTIKKIPNKTYMYDKLKVPGVLIECGFLSNANERTKLVTPAYQKKLAYLIKEAIITYY